MGAVGKPLNIKDPETSILARDLAALTGETITDAIKAAVQERLVRERRCRGRTIDRQAVQLIADRIAARPILDERSPDDLVDYDEYGLPR